MKKALILSFALAVVLGMTGCTMEEKLQNAADSAMETVEKPVMILGDELEEAADAVTETTEEAVDAVIETGEEMVEKAEDMMDGDAEAKVEVEAEMEK